MSIKTPLGTGAGASGATAATFLLRDQFTTNDAAPITSPRTCEPGPGTLTFIDGNNIMSIAGGVLLLSGTGAGVTDGILTGAQTRAAGLAVKAVLSGDGGWGNGNANMGFFDTSLTNIEDALRISPTAGSEVSQIVNSAILGGNTVITYGSMINAFGHGAQYTVILRSAGAFFIINDVLVWVSEIGSSATLLGGMRFSANAYVMTVDDFRVFQLASPWTSDAGIYTSYTASPADGATATMTPDAIVKFTWTPASSEVLNLMYRREDDDNTWIVRCDQANSWIRIYDKQASAETQLATAAQTWTPGTPYIIQLAVDGYKHYTIVDNTAKASYTTARTFNLRSTGLKVSGFTTGASLYAWPRYITGSALTELMRFD